MFEANVKEPLVLTDTALDVIIVSLNVFDWMVTGLVPPTRVISDCCCSLSRAPVEESRMALSGVVVAAVILESVQAKAMTLLPSLVRLQISLYCNLVLEKTLLVIYKVPANSLSCSIKP